MRVLSSAAKQAVQSVIDQHLADLQGLDGFISAEPGFGIVDGAVLREPSILIFVRQKKPLSALGAEDRAPRQLGTYRVTVLQAAPLRQLDVGSVFSDMSARLADAASALTYQGIQDDPIDRSFVIERPMLCHVGPDAGWPTLKPFLEATERTLSVAMYDFNADYIARTFIDLVRDNDIKVMLTWDDGMTAPEKAIRLKLRQSLGDSLDGWIVKCGSGRRFSSAYHEKVAVRDSSAFWLSSGNWSLRSQPEIDPIANPAAAKGMFSKGNREWHVIVEDVPLAQLFEQYIRHDRDGSEAEQQAGEPGIALEVEDPAYLPDLFVPLDDLLSGVALAAPVEPTAPRALPSQTRPVTVQPVLTPDNYLPRITALLKSAKRSVYLQFAYITWSDGGQDGRFRELLKLLASLTYKPGLDVRIIVGDADAADKVRLLAQNGFNDKVFRVQRSIHNKGIIIDGETVLISSTNWSSDGVLRNRDAGLIIHDPEVAAYYQTVFLDDWDNRARSQLDTGPRAILAEEGAPTPPGMVRMSWRDFHEI